MLPLFCPVDDVTGCGNPALWSQTVYWILNGHMLFARVGLLCLVKVLGDTRNTLAMVGHSSSIYGWHMALFPSSLLRRYFCKTHDCFVTSNILANFCTHIAVVLMSHVTILQVYGCYGCMWCVSKQYNFKGTLKEVFQTV